MDQIIVYIFTHIKKKIKILGNSEIGGRRGGLVLEPFGIMPDAPPGGRGGG